VTEAARAGLMEVELGRIASKAGSEREGVRTRMMNDDAKANAEPKALASRESVEIPL
jgi:hypothetical protein